MIKTGFFVAAFIVLLGAGGYVLYQNKSGGTPTTTGALTATPALVTTSVTPTPTPLAQQSTTTLADTATKEVLKDSDLSALPEEDPTLLDTYSYTSDLSGFDKASQTANDL